MACDAQHGSTVSKTLQGRRRPVNCPRGVTSCGALQHFLLTPLPAAPTPDPTATNSCCAAVQSAKQREFGRRGEE